jgi:hypothetical protein
LIRPIRRDDIAKLKSLGGYEWTFEHDFIEGLVFTDEQDQPVLFAGAWHRAEVHLAVDHEWATPGARLLALKQLHDAMENELAVRGVGQVITWIDDKLKRFSKRLEVWGWIESQKKSWQRRVDGKLRN